jgi:hypothetical protein
MWSNEVGPRVVGGQYLSHYWGTTYTVESIILDTGDWRGWCMTVLWADGHRTTHCTAWNRRDKVAQ